MSHAEESDGRSVWERAADLAWAARLAVFDDPMTAAEFVIDRSRRMGPAPEATALRTAVRRFGWRDDPAPADLARALRKAAQSTRKEPVALTISGALLSAAEAVEARWP